MAGKKLQLAIDGNAISMPKRKGYTREYKLKFYRDNDNNLYNTHKMFGLNTETGYKRWGNDKKECQRCKAC